MFENSAMVNILIAISLVLLVARGLAALILEGRPNNSGSDCSPKPDAEEDGR